MRTDPIGPTDCHPPAPDYDRAVEVDHLAANRVHSYLVEHAITRPQRSAIWAAAAVRRAFYCAALTEDGHGGYQRGPRAEHYCPAIPDTADRRQRAFEAIVRDASRLAADTSRVHYVCLPDGYDWHSISRRHPAEMFDSYADGVQANPDGSTQII